MIGLNIASLVRNVIIFANEEQMTQVLESDILKSLFVSYKF